MRISLLIVIICAGLSACDRSTAGKDGSTEIYFDLKSFFEKESRRLNQLQKPVLKTVSRNHTRESKEVTINWINELTLFAESDINKPAWRNSYQILSAPGRIEYSALDDNLKTRKITINRSGEQIRSIRIINQTSNFLYSSTEHLHYFPDSAYVISKDQHVKVLGNNRYQITGRFK